MDVAGAFLAVGLAVALFFAGVFLGTAVFFSVVLLDESVELFAAVPRVLTSPVLFGAVDGGADCLAEATDLG